MVLVGMVLVGMVLVGMVLVGMVLVGMVRVGGVGEAGGGALTVGTVVAEPGLVAGVNWGSSCRGASRGGKVAMTEVVGPPTDPSAGTVLDPGRGVGWPVTVTGPGG